MTAATTTAPGTAAGTELDYRPSYLAATCTAAAILVLYIVTLSPSTDLWDTGEYMAVSQILGMPHPPGNPLFVLLGRVFAILPIAPTVPQRINMLAAISSAASAGFWFLVTERVLVGWLSRRWQRIVAGATAALIGATAFTVWNQSVVNEKVYTLSLVGFAVVSWLVVRWCDDPEGAKADRLLVLVAYLLGLGYANHMAGLLPAPAVAIAVLVRQPRTLLRWRLLLACVAALLFGLTPFATQPIRSAHFPIINEGETTACTAGRPEVGCTFTDLTKQRFLDNFNRTQYGKPQVTDRQAPFTSQIGMWWLYFKWQWTRDAYGDDRGLQTALAVLFLGLGLLGGWVHWRRDPRSFAYFGPLVFILTIGLIYYLNFRLGYTQAQQMGVPINDLQRVEVRDRDYFYIWSFSTWSVWAALGLVQLWEWLAERLGAERVRVGRQTLVLPTRRSWLLASPVLAIALIPLVANFRAASHRGDTVARDFAHDLLNSVEPYGVIITGGDNDTFPLWYAQEVEGIRRDVTVAVSSYLGTDWYVRQLIRNPVRDYDAAKGPAIYRNREWKKPTKPLLSLTMEQADAIPPYIEIREPQTFRKGNLVAEFQPRVLTRDQLVVLRMILDSFPERPLYFARSAGGYGFDLGLGPYLMTQGLARKLLPDVPTPSRDTLIVTGDGWLDVPTSYALWDSVFTGPAAIVRRGKWIDRASASIAFVYVDAGDRLSIALAQTGRRPQAERIRDRIEHVADAARLGDVLGPRGQSLEPAPEIPQLLDTSRR